MALTPLATVATPNAGGNRPMKAGPTVVFATATCHCPELPGETAGAEAKGRRNGGSVGGSFANSTTWLISDKTTTPEIIGRYTRMLIF
jgi:hypothetical protein